MASSWKSIGTYTRATTLHNRIRRWDSWDLLCLVTHRLYVMSNAQYCWQRALPHARDWSINCLFYIYISLRGYGKLSNTQPFADYVIYKPTIEPLHITLSWIFECTVILVITQRLADEFQFFDASACFHVSLFEQRLELRQTTGCLIHLNRTKWTPFWIGNLQTHWNGRNMYFDKKITEIWS